MPGIIFSQNADCRFLYESNQSARWCAYLLTENSTYQEESIEFSEAWNNKGYYLFAASPPKNPMEFVKNAWKYFASVKQHYTWVTLAWLTNIESIIDKNVLLLPIQQSTPNNFITQNAFNLYIGNNFTTLFINKSSTIKIIANETTSEFVISNFVPTNITFKNNSPGSHNNAVVMNNLSIPFSGTGVGRLRTKIGFNTGTDFDDFDINLKYFHPGDQKNVTEVSFPFLQGESQNLLMVTVASFDPFDYLNTANDHSNTYFALTGESYHTDTKEIGSLVLKSFFTTDTGHYISLIPSVNLVEEDSDSSNNLFPQPHSSLLVFSERTPGGKLPFYMVPKGDFILSVSEKVLSSSNDHGQLNLLCGLSGTETVSFTPNTVNEVGDRIRFFPKNKAFAPIFPLQKVSITKPSKDKDLLDGQYETAWINILSNDKGSNQYSSQPDGASLYAKDQGINSKSIPDLLGYYEPSVEVPQLEEFCFPMVPYCGKTFTDLTGNQQKTSLPKLESQIINPSRKALIAKNTAVKAGSKSQAVSGAKNNKTSNTEKTIYSTTNQGLIAAVKATGQWQELLLAQNTKGDRSGCNYLPPKDSDHTTSAAYQLGFVNLKTMPSECISN